MGAKRWVACLGLLGAVAGCGALNRELKQAEIAFGEARYEDTETWLSDLESDLPHMDRAMRGKFYYLRGTTAFRLEDQANARHYLALAREEARLDSEALRADRLEEVERMLLALEGYETAAEQTRESLKSSGNQQVLDQEAVPFLSGKQLP